MSTGKEQHHAFMDSLRSTLPAEKVIDKQIQQMPQVTEDNVLQLLYEELLEYLTKHVDGN